MQRLAAPCPISCISDHKARSESVATADGSRDAPPGLGRQCASARVDRFFHHRGTSVLRLAARHLHKPENPAELYPLPEPGIAQIRSAAPRAPDNFVDAPF